jgi:4-hydroxybenzoate polyprenyltransferase
MDQVSKNVLEPKSNLTSVGQVIQGLVKELRPKQWTKNLIIFFPLLFSGKFGETSLIFAAAICVAVFCLISSGIYVLNDVIDVQADRAHPTKRFRPIASGALNVRLAVFVGLICVLLGFILAYTLRPALALVCLAYVVLNVLYSSALKNFAIIDVLCIASGFVIRAVAGAVAVRVIPSAWFLLCTSLGALFLALEKRRQELILLNENSSVHRKALDGYSSNLMSRLEALVVPTLLTSYAFYSFLSQHGQWMMLTIPVVLYGVMRYQMLSERENITGMPEDVLWKDRPIQVTIVVWIAICALVVYGNPGGWLRSLVELVDSYRLGP